MARMALNFVFNLYRRLFARKSFYLFNKLLFDLGVRGMGLFNFENDRISGEYSFFQNFLAGRNSLQIFDVGANKGQYSCRIRTICPDATIYAFEPHPVTFSLLQPEAVRHNLEAINKGLSDISGSMQLFDRTDNNDGSEHASLYRQVIEDIHGSGATACNVIITTIDDFMAERNIRHIDLLKIDTEGNELKVLQGARTALASQMIDMIQIEFNEMNVASRVFFRDFFTILSSYSCYRLLPGDLLPIVNYRPLYHELFAFQNLLFIRRGSSYDISLRGLPPCP